MNKGRWIYLSIILINVVLVLLPTATSLFQMSLGTLEETNWLYWIPDILGVVSVIIGYMVIKLFYKKHASYVKHYPYLALAVAMIWTVAVQIK